MEVLPVVDGVASSRSSTRPPRRRAAMFEPGEAGERDELTPGHRDDAPRALAALRLLHLLVEDRRHLGAEPRARARRQQAERGAVEADGQLAHDHAFRGVRRFCRAIFTARSSRPASSRATSRPAGRMP